jgi:hypothetical protein
MHASCPPSLHPSQLYILRTLCFETYSIRQIKTQKLFRKVTSLYRTCSTTNFVTEFTILSDNASDLYSGGSQLEFRLGHLLSWLRIFVFFLSTYT